MKAGPTANCWVDRMVDETVVKLDKMWVSQSAATTAALWGSSPAAWTGESLGRQKAERSGGFEAGQTVAWMGASMAVGKALSLAEY